MTINRAAWLALVLLGVFLILLAGRDTLYHEGWSRQKRMKEYFASPFFFVAAICFVMAGVILIAQ